MSDWNTYCIVQVNSKEGTIQFIEHEHGKKRVMLFRVGAKQANMIVNGNNFIMDVDAPTLIKRLIVLFRAPASSKVDT